MQIKRNIKKKIRESKKVEQLVLKFFGIFNIIYQYAYVSKLDQKIIKQLCKDNIVVIGGPFEGLQYAGLEATGSSLGLKIAGIYEEELGGVFQHIIGEQYEHIWDIGAAEGYYAVGLAVKMPNCKVLAYDTDPYARELLQKMAVENGVRDRLLIKGLCSRETIKKGNFFKRTLIIMDCEGYEKELLCEETKNYLSNVDILVEVHDDLGRGEHEIGDQIRKNFSETHDIEVIKSISTVEKMCRHRNEELFKSFLDEELYEFMREREWRMEWLYMKARKK